MLQTSTYGEFSLHLHSRLRGHRIPLSGMIEVTYRCPLACLHCYNNLPMGDAVARAQELTVEEHHRILDEIAEAGCFWLTYTGGEIFARKDFFDIYRYAKQKGFLITLFTNGLLINERVANTLAEWRPFSIEISLYGATRETYARLTRRPDAYDRVMRAIHLLLERQLPLKLKTVAVTLNRHEVYAMQRIAEDLGVPFKFDPHINARIDCSHSPLATRLSPEEVVELDLRDPKRCQEWVDLLQRVQKPAAPVMQRSPLYLCGGGVTAFAIDPYGRLSICVLSHRDTYDLRRGSFREGWERFFGQIRARTITRPTKCTRCGIRPMCVTCPATSELEHGDPEKPVDYFCHIAHLRAYALEIDVPEHGACAYCPGGDRYEEILEEVRRLRERVARGEYLTERPSVWALQTGSPSGCGAGCSTCSAGVPIDPAGPDALIPVIPVRNTPDWKGNEKGYCEEDRE